MCPIAFFDSTDAKMRNFKMDKTSKLIKKRNLRFHARGDLQTVCVWVCMSVRNKTVWLVYVLLSSFKNTLWRGKPIRKQRERSAVTCKWPIWATI